MFPVLLLSAVLSWPPTPHFTFDPPAPTSHTFVSLRMRNYDGCQTEPFATRNDNVIDVVWPLHPPDGGCAGVIVPIDTRVPLGVLPAGEYEVRIRFYTQPVRTMRLQVADATHKMRFDPPVVSTRGGTVLTIDAEPGACFNNGVVTIGGEVVPSTTRDCSVTVTAPPREAGAVDVRIDALGKTHGAQMVLRYSDPAAPDDASFEHMLVPLLFNGGGQFGSKWVTEGRVVNRSRLPLVFAGATLSPNDPRSLAYLGNRPNGVVLFVPRAYADLLDFGANVRERSREDASWGAELPIVRERDFGNDLYLENVPLDARYRTILRIYDVDGPSQQVTIIGTAGQQRFSANVDLQQFAPDEPGFAAIDLNALFPKFVGKGPFTILVRPYYVHWHDRHWAFASVTNNATQTVTIITP